MNYFIIALLLSISAFVYYANTTINNQREEIDNKTLLIDSLKKESVGLNLVIKRQNETTQIMADSYAKLHEATKEEAKKYVQRIKELEQFNATDKDFKSWSDADIPNAANDWLQRLQEDSGNN